MKGKARTDTQGKNYGQSTDVPQWRPVRWQWRRPRFLEVTSSLTTLPVAAVVVEHVPDGATSLSVAGALVLHAAANLAARCIRRTRD
ncbi:hypothetical protein [Streptomyces acidiscabies]|uniref:hypothetical protein n=1 Tax=Streptomyces acidiscabies TaxID=42234 RepID=UPI00095167A5|nr:hypothetical protein [Streptomyces acidiscabies]